MNSRVNLAPNRIDGLWLENPVLTASGTFGYGTDYNDLIDIQQLGGIVSKAVGPTPRRGNVSPRLYDTPAGLLNSIGLQGIGVDAVLDEKAPLWAKWRVPIIVNVVGHSIDDFCYVTERLDGQPGVAGLEINISCPNVEGGLEFGTDPRGASQLIKAVRRRTELPVIAKLTPQAPSVPEIARACVDAGADALTVCNTFLGMAIDIKKKKPVFAATMAGLSGPAIRPLALRHTYEVAQAVSVPIIGCGGIMNADDALEFLMAGATAVQVGTATFREPATPLRVAAGIDQYLKANGTSLGDIVGLALPAVEPV